MHLVQVSFDVEISSLVQSQVPCLFDQHMDSKEAKCCQIKIGFANVADSDFRLRIHIFEPDPGPTVIVTDDAATLSTMVFPQKGGEGLFRGEFAVISQYSNEPHSKTTHRSKQNQSSATA